MRPTWLAAARTVTVAVSLVSVAGVLAGVARPTATATDHSTISHSDRPVYTTGLLGNRQTVVALTSAEAAGAAYVPGSSVLALPGGHWEYVPPGAAGPVTVPAGNAGALASIRRSRAWLASGVIPGSTAQEKQMAARALLDLRLLTRPDGAVATAWYGEWKYSWPRDSSFAAVAFAMTGHSQEAYRILRYNATAQLAPSWPGQSRPYGTWNARTLLDGSGPPDDRHWQPDADGWVPWSVWEWFQTSPGPRRIQRARALYPSVERAADYTADSLDAQGLPPAEPDYWEEDTSAPNIGTAAPLLAGLHAAADLARHLGHPADARHWSDAARNLAARMAGTFAKNGYQRTTVDGSGLDSAVTFMAPPFNPPAPGLASDIRHTFSLLRQANGGVIPGQARSGTTTWTPETAFFALAWSGPWSGTASAARATGLVDWLYSHRTSLGALPEQVTQGGDPYSVAPLAWTDALTLMTLTQLGGCGIPVPPAAPGRGRHRLSVGPAQRCQGGTAGVRSAASG